MNMEQRPGIRINKVNMYNSLLKNIYDEHFQRISKGKLHYPTGEAYSDRFITKMINYYISMEDYEKCSVISKVKNIYT